MGETAADTEATGTRRRHTVISGLVSAAPHLAQQQQGLVITPDALNWCVRHTYLFFPAPLPSCQPELVTSPNRMQDPISCLIAPAALSARARLTVGCVGCTL